VVIIEETTMEETPITTDMITAILIPPDRTIIVSDRYKPRRKTNKDP